MLMASPSTGEFTKMGSDAVVVFSFTAVNYS